MAIQIFSLVVLVTIAFTLAGVMIALAMWPGKTARARNHPYADAVQIAGWAGILAGGVLWPLALIWAYATPTPTEESLPAPARTGSETGTGAET